MGLEQAVIQMQMKVVFLDVGGYQGQSQHWKMQVQTEKLGWNLSVPCNKIPSDTGPSGPWVQLRGAKSLNT